MMKNPSSRAHSHHHAPPCTCIPFHCNGRPCCMFIFLYEPICIGSSCRSPLKCSTRARVLAFFHHSTQTCICAFFCHWTRACICANVLQVHFPG